MTHLSSVEVVRAPSLPDVHAFAALEPLADERVRVQVGFSKPIDSEPIRAADVEATFHDEAGNELRAKRLSDDGEHLPEVHIGGATAAAFYEVEVPTGARIAEARVALRGVAVRLGVE